MSLHKVQNIFISDGTALPVNNAAVTTLADGVCAVGVFGIDATALNPAGGDTVTTQESIFIYQKNHAGELKKSMIIPGRTITKYEGASYLAPTREVWTIGYNRVTLTGAIEVNVGAEYNFRIVFKGDRNLYAERQYAPSFSVMADCGAATCDPVTAADELEIATKITNAINNDPRTKKYVLAVLVGNGTGVHGLTAATDYGVEISSKILTQFNTSYFEDRAMFSVHVDDSSGFGCTTPATQILAGSYGVGTYLQVYNMENFDYQYEGVLNRVKWPIPALTYCAENTFINSGAIAQTALLGVIGEDTVTFSADVSAVLFAGDKVVLGGVNYEILYFISTTVAVLSTVLSAGLVAAAVLKRFQYDLYNVEFNNVSNSEGTNTMSASEQSIVIAVPAIDAGESATPGAAQSVSGAQIEDILNSYAGSSPLAFPAQAL